MSTNHTAVAAAIQREALAILGRPLAPGLHLVATPIGNLGDVSLRALATLANADRIYCEDTRHSIRLLNHYGIRRPLAAYHEHNADLARPEILAGLASGQRLALISDAGTPLVSDPGYKLVCATTAAGHAVYAVPGASALLAALSVAGLPTDAFLFAGFLSPKVGRRRERLATLLAAPHTLVLFEAPTRLAETVAEIAAIDPTRPVAIARELTKLHETVWRSEAATLAAELANKDDIKGECVVLIGPATATTTTDDAVIAAALKAALATVPLSAAVRTVAASLDVSRSHVYGLALAMKRSDQP